MPGESMPPERVPAANDMPAQEPEPASPAEPSRPAVAEYGAAPADVTVQLFES